jgi:competence protein ComEC
VPLWGERYLGDLMYISFFYFGSALLGALVGTYFKFPLFFLLVPLLLGIYKKPRLALAILFFLLSNFQIVNNATLKGEFVGTIKTVQDGSSVAEVSYFDGVSWKRLNFDVLIYKEESLGTIVYFTGELRKRSSYPLFYAKMEYCATATNYSSPMYAIYKNFEEFRSYTERIDSFYKNLFGNSSRDEDFVNSGLFHIFCVSGMHVSILYLLTTYLVNLFVYKKLYRIVLSLVFPTAFVIGSGMNIPSLRALIMLYTLSIFQILDYKVNPVNIVSIVGTGMIISNPEIAFSLSFYMTFFSTIGVLISSNNLLANVGGFLGSSPYVSMINPINPFSIIATVLVSIPVEIILFGLTISYLFYTIHIYYLSDFILSALLPFVWFVRIIAHLFANFPKIPQHPIVTIAFALTFIVYIGIILEKKAVE